MRQMIRGITFLLAVAFMAACRDRTPTAPSNAIADWRAPNAAPAALAAPCLSISDLNALADAVFAGDRSKANEVKEQIEKIEKAMKKNDKKKAAEYAFDAVAFILKEQSKTKSGKDDDGRGGRGNENGDDGRGGGRGGRGGEDDEHPIAGTPQQVASLISGIFCIAGINVTVTDPANATIVNPSKTTQVVKSADGTAGTQLPPGSITEPTVLEFKKVPNTFPANSGQGPLDTRLDQYPGFFLITAGSASGSRLPVPVTVAICLDPSISLSALPNSVRRRLRLGHQKTTGFVIAPLAPDVSFLKCPAPPVPVGFLPGWLNKALSMFLPRTLNAAVFQDEPFERGVGGLATEFSPFDPVDTELSFDRGGVGGLATEFKRTGVDATGTVPLRPSLEASSVNPGVLATPGLAAHLAVPATDACAAGFPWGTQVTPACRPDIVLHTRLGTVMRNVPISWNIGIGGGTIAIAPACTTFGASTTGAKTDVNGRSSVCWTLGATPGLNNNTVSATPSVGGDAEPGVVFVPPTGTFTATAIRRTPVVNITCVDAVYNGSDRNPCTALATDPVAGGSLGSVLVTPIAYGTVPITVPTTPKNAGTYTADASYVETALYFGMSAAQKTFQITKVTPTLQTTCQATVYYTGANQFPCSATATGVGADGLLSPTPSVTYFPTPPNLPGVYKAIGYFVGATNYWPAADTVAFNIIGFFDGFEAPSGWTTSGFWNRNTFSPTILNAAKLGGFVNLALGDGSGGALPLPFPGAYAFWYGETSTGSYVGTSTPGGGPLFGGTSPGPNSGTLTSPDVAIPADLGQTPTLRFDTWFEIEGVQPAQFDLMKVSVQNLGTGQISDLGVLNPLVNSFGPPATPFTSGGFNVPPVWMAVAKDLSAFRGLVVRFRFSFNTVDPLYNGFRGWIVDNVRVTSAPVVAAVASRRAAQPGPGMLPTRDLNPVPPPAPVRLP